MKFKRLKEVTLPVLRLTPNKPRYIKIMSPITVGKQIDDKKEPAHICTAIDLETYDTGIVVCPLVMRKELAEAYPGEKYVGRCFEVSTFRQPGKAYNHVTLIEVAEPDDFAEALEARRHNRNGDAQANAAAVEADKGQPVTVDEMGNVIPDVARAQESAKAATRTARR